MVWHDLRRKRRGWRVWDGELGFPAWWIGAWYVLRGSDSEPAARRAREGLLLGKVLPYLDPSTRWTCF
jgi:hypothetical protein